MGLPTILRLISRMLPGSSSAGVFAKVEKLRTFPRIGSVPLEISDLPYRQLIVPPCRIFYRIEGKRVYIVHVMRSEKMLRLQKLDRRSPRLRLPQKRENSRG
jgi:toxin ParE1/3/4